MALSPVLQCINTVVMLRIFVPVEYTPAYLNPHSVLQQFIGNRFTSLDWTSIWGCKPQVQTNWTVELYYLITICIFLINLWLHDIQICIFWKNLPNRYRPLNLPSEAWIARVTWSVNVWGHCPLAARRAFHTLSISTYTTQLSPRNCMEVTWDSIQHIALVTIEFHW